MEQRGGATLTCIQKAFVQLAVAARCQTLSIPDSSPEPWRHLWSCVCYQGLGESLCGCIVVHLSYCINEVWLIICCQTALSFKSHHPAYGIAHEPTHNLNMMNVPLVWPNEKLRLDPTLQLVVWGEQPRGVVFPMRIFMWEEFEYKQCLLLPEGCRNPGQPCRVKHPSSDPRNRIFTSLSLLP